MKKIFIIASDSGTYFSKFLKVMTQEKYVHISITLEPDFKDIYSFGRKTKYMLPAGFVNESFEVISELFTGAICQIYELKISNKNYLKIKKILQEEYINNAVKFRYNIKGLPMINFNISYNRKYHYVCSQFCGKLLSDSKIVDFKKHYSLIKPRDILNIKGLNLIYEGKVVDYLKHIKKDLI